MPCFRFFTNHLTDCSHKFLRLAKNCLRFFYTFIFSVHGTLDSVDQVGAPCYTKETKFCCLWNWNWNCCSYMLFIIHVTQYPLISIHSLSVWTLRDGVYSPVSHSRIILWIFSKLFHNLTVYSNDFELDNGMIHNDCETSLVFSINFFLLMHY